MLALYGWRGPGMVGCSADIGAAPEGFRHHTAPLPPLLLQVRRSDVLSAWSGIRPLALDPNAAGGWVNAWLGYPSELCSWAVTTFCAVVFSPPLPAPPPPPPPPPLLLPQTPPARRATTSSPWTPTE